MAHFMGREQGGKGMVICIDKLTAVKMYDKVKEVLEGIPRRPQSRVAACRPAEASGSGSQDQVTWKRPTWRWSMSQQQNEVDYFKEKGLRHRRRTASGW